MLTLQRSTLTGVEMKDGGEREQNSEAPKREISERILQRGLSKMVLLKVICANCHGIRQKARFTKCSRCHQLAPYEFHHVEGPFKNGATKKGPVIVLCLNCHRKEHAMGDRAAKFRNDAEVQEQRIFENGEERY